MISRLTLLFEQVTAAENRTVARQHIAGWSEGFWRDGELAASNRRIRDLAEARAPLLASSATIIGFRIGRYDIVRNKLVPLGTSAGKFQFPGNSRYPCDLPQVSLELSGHAVNVPNSSRFNLRGIPDQMMVTGEYTPTGGFINNLLAYRQRLVNDLWGMLGRVLSEPRVRVVSIKDRLLTVEAELSEVPPMNVRFSRVYDINKKPIKGSAYISGRPGPLVYTLPPSFEGIEAKEGGTVRVDKIAVYAFGSVDIGRAVVRKVGRPFEQYRGRASKR